MAVSGAVIGWASKASNATTDVQPGAGVEWLIHTIVAESGKALEVYLTENGSTFTLADTISAGGSSHNLMYRVSNTFWMRLKNVSGGTAYNGYMGVITKE